MIFSDKESQMLRSCFLAFLIVMISASSAFAGKACYTKSEAEAEQGLRIHSELMVIGLNCQHLKRTSGGENLYNAYREFTAKNSGVFAKYERDLMDYYQRTGAGDPQAALDTLRTQLANKISLDAAKMRPDIFCYYYAPRVDKASGMNEDDIRQWAATFYPSHPVSRPLCEH